VESQLRDLSAHLQIVREEEKASIAREIHDDLGSTLTAMKMKAFQLKTSLPENKMPHLEHVESMSQLINDASCVARRIITGLRPTILDDLGLLAALEWQAGQFHKLSGIECRVNCIGDKGNLDQQRSIALFRILQEALTNVSRHSGASRVEIEFHHSDEEVVMSVIDNGRGITENRTDTSAHYGILGMCERADHLGGNINFNTPPGGGFSVTAISEAPVWVANDHLPLDFPRIGERRGLPLRDMQELAAVMSHALDDDGVVGNAGRRVDRGLCALQVLDVGDEQCEIGCIRSQAAQVQRR
jgi:signal transduction histidine kinase